MNHREKLIEKAIQAAIQLENYARSLRLYLAGTPQEIVKHLEQEKERANVW